VLPNTGEPVTTLDAATLALFSEKPATYYQNVTSVPDFATAAQLLQDFWKRTQSTPIDGVISADPVALSYLLNATGPLSLRTGDTLSADNAVQLLLNEVYLRTAPTPPRRRTRSRTRSSRSRPPLCSTPSRRERATPRS